MVIWIKTYWACWFNSPFLLNGYIVYIGYLVVFSLGRILSILYTLISIPARRFTGHLLLIFVWCVFSFKYFLL